MDIVNKFKAYLFSQKKAPSKITVKNYLSDLKKFINWYQQTFQITFTPDALTAATIMQYASYTHSPLESSQPAARSAKRYISSLRKFGTYLHESGEIKNNPFPIIQQDQKISSDPFFLKEFNNFLYSEQASKLTIKNYIADIKQFLDWLEKVTNTNPQTDSDTLLIKIDNYALQQYKMRLFKEANLSPLSINRKLSSLRRYIRWLAEKGILNASIDEINLDKPAYPVQKEENESITSDIPLTALQGLSEEKEVQKFPHYSPFGPIRLFQKTTKIINLGADLLLFSPLARSAGMIQFSLWKKGKKTVFTPVTNILAASSYTPKSISIKTIIPKQTSIIPPRSANIASVLEKIHRYGIGKNSDSVHNFTKALYAPLKISTKHMHWKEKLWLSLRHKRPEWYRKYHSYTFVTYLHFGIMMIATVILGATIYQTWTGSSLKQTQAVLSAQATAPPRTLSFQGRLLDKNNTPITAETPLRFALYNSPIATGAALLWQEKQDVKPDRNGNFTTTLGMKSRIDQNLFIDNPSLYIGITIGDNQEFVPREQIPTAEYATNSQTVEGLKPITDSPNLAQNVLLALDSSGNLTIGGDVGHTFQATGGQFTLSGQTLLLTTNPGTNGNIQIIPDGSGIIDLEKPIQNISNRSNPSGIPGAVEVDDILSVLATSSSQSALVINQNGTGDIISGRSNGIDKFRLDNAGNAFLGGDITLKGDTIGTTSNIFDIAGDNVRTLTIGTNATALSLGGAAGITAVNNSLSVHGTTSLSGPVNTSELLTANGGLTIAHGQTLTIASFSAGAIPFINGSSQVVQDASNFSWDDGNKTLKVLGSLCINSVSSGTCSSTPGTITGNNLNIQTAADLAENYISSQNLEPGDLVIPEGSSNSMAIIKSTSAYQHQLIGVISTNPGVTLNSGAATDPNHPYLYPLALQGRVPVKVSSMNGQIQAGDDLTSSTIPGVAMKATDSGQIIGKALESYTNADPTAVGKIMTFVNLTYRSTPAMITDNGNLAIATESGTLQNNTNQNTATAIVNSLNNVVTTISLGIVKTQTLSTQSLQVATDNIMIGGQTLKEYITALVKQLINQELNKRLATLSQNPQIINPVASNSAQTTDQTVSDFPTPTSIASNSAALQTAPTQTGTPSATLYNSISSSSAIASIAALPTASDSGALSRSSSATSELQNNNQPFNSLDNNTNNQYESIASYSGKLTYVPNFKSDFATFNQGLIALGPTSLTDVAVSNTLTINNNLRITQSSLDTIGSDLNIQPLRQGNVLFMSGLVAIDTQGNLLVKGNASFSHNVTVNGQLATGIIAPIPDQDLVINLKNKSNKTGSALIITNATGSSVLRINQSGDVISSGEARFNAIASNGFSIIRGAQADTSMTQTVADGSAGNGTITAYETERTIITPYVTDHSLIYVTATSDTGNVIPYLARQTVENPSTGTKGTFTVAIQSPITKDISFNWWIVN